MLEKSPVVEKRSTVDDDLPTQSETASPHSDVIMVLVNRCPYVTFSYHKSSNRSPAPNISRASITSRV